VLRFLLFVHTLGTWLTELRLSACAGYSWDRHDAIFLFHLFFPPCAWAWDVYSLFNENPLEMGGKGLWRGVGEPPLRGLYNVLASSSIGHHQFREEASTRSARIFVAAVSTSELPNEAVFPSRPSSAASLGKFQTIRRARREAGTRPRSPRFKWRAGTPHPPLHQPSGAESTTMNGSSRALVCELHERATRPP